MSCMSGSSLTRSVKRLVAWALSSSSRTGAHSGSGALSRFGLRLRKSSGSWDLNIAPLSLDSDRLTRLESKVAALRRDLTGVQAMIADHVVEEASSRRLLDRLRSEVED